ncbi:MAG: hypothetical protein E7H57_01260 [Pantoea sp.]|nr:hypothetical protein [Pantoea sp.]
MNKYVIFISDNKSKAVLKEKVTRAVIKQMKENGFRKYHVEIAAENEKDAVLKLNDSNESYLTALADFSGNILFLAVIIIIISIFYFLEW